MQRTQYTIGIIGAIALISFGVWYQHRIWSECRETNSVFYCWHVITR